MSTSAASNSSPSAELLDHDPPENPIDDLNTTELKNKLFKKLEELRQAAAARGEPSYNEESQDIGDDGRMLGDRVVRYERILRVHKVMQTPGKKTKRSQKPKQKARVIRRDHFRRDGPQPNNLNSNQPERKVFWRRRRLCVQIARTSPLPY